MQTPNLVGIEHIAGAILVIFVILFIARMIARKTHERFESVARHYNAKVVVEGIFINPVLQISSEFGLVEVRTSRGSKNTPPTTRALIRLDNVPNLSLNVFPEGHFAKIGKMLGMPDIQLNSPLFDQAYIVQSNNELTVRTFLSETLQDILLKLVDSKPKLELRQGELSYTVFHHYHEEDKLRSFVDDALSVLSHYEKLGLSLARAE